MGEIADMMLDGTMCENCGSFIGDSIGYPRYCSKSCAQDRGAIVSSNKPTLKKTKCPTCQRKVKEVGLKDHMRDAHGVK